MTSSIDEPAEPHPAPDIVPGDCVSATSLLTNGTARDALRRLARALGRLAAREYLAASVATTVEPTASANKPGSGPDARTEDGT